MRKFLVTGGAGFIGSSITEKLLKDPENYVVVVDNLLTGSVDRLPDPLPDNCKFIRGDVNNLNDILPVMVSYSFDYVFHYAAVVGVSRTLKNPSLVLNDIQGIKNILDLSKSTGVKRVFYSSSSEVYGEPVEFPQNELTTPLNSKLPYAVVKNVGEAFCRSYKREFDLDFTIFRFFNTYGPKQSTDFVMSRFIRAAINGEDLTIFGDGTQTRTYCYVNDNIDMCLAALYENEFVNDVVNIGNDNEISVIHLADKIKETLNSDSRIVFLPALKEGDMERRHPDISKMKGILDRDLIPLEKGIKMVANSRQFQERVLVNLI